MRPINLIPDPRKPVPGVTCLQSFDALVTVTSRPLFSDDPFGLGRRIPALPAVIVIPEFLLELDSRWRLDGHRFFINNEMGFFCDQVVSPNTQGELFSVDRNTSLSYLDGFHIDETRIKIVRKLAGRVGVAVSLEVSNWGSFLARVAPKAAVLRQQRCDYLLVYGRSRNHIDLMLKMGWREEQIIQFDPSCNYVADTFVYPSEPTKNLYMSAPAVSALRGFYPAGSRRIYISRSKGVAAASARRVINADAVEKAMTRLGFDIVCPDLLGLEAQVRVFSEAEFIVGPSGAGMFNAVFSPPRTKIIDIESVSNWIYGHVGLFGSFDARFGIHWGSPVDGSAAHRPFQIDIGSIERRVEEMLGR